MVYRVVSPMAQTYYSGRVLSVLFRNDGNGYYILKMQLDTGGPPISVKGSILGMDVKTSSWFGFEAEKSHHDVHGPQLEIKRAPVVLDWNPEVAIHILQAQGVSLWKTDLLYVHLGSDLVTVLDTYHLEGVPGLTDTECLEVVDRWRVARAFYRTMDIMTSVGIPQRLTNQVWKTFGDQAAEVLTTNPWRLVQIDGVSFEHADAIATHLRLNMMCPERMEGAVLFVQKSRKGMGHLFLTPADIKDAVSQMLPSTSEATIMQAVASLHKAKLLVVDRKTRAGFTAVYEPWFHKVESESALLLRERLQTASYERDPDILNHMALSLAATGPLATAANQAVPVVLRDVAAASLQDWASGSNVVLSEKQKQGVVNALTAPVSVVTGLPGTGKSTSLKALIELLRESKTSFLQIAPTGIAAKRMQAVTGAVASTIHRAFGAKGWNKGTDGRTATYVGVTSTTQSLEGSDGSGEQWACSKAPHSADVIICDEASMVDQHLLYRILTCTKPTARLVFIGDAQQLPSVGPGNVLQDIINSNVCPVVALTEIFRQENTSEIVLASHAISQGIVPEVNGPRKEFVFVEKVSDMDVQDCIVQEALQLFNQRIPFQVMSPRHQGLVGVTRLNERLREPINPKVGGVHEIRLGSETIREGDRIMIVKNNYELDIYNGDTGKVEGLPRDKKSDSVVSIKIHGGTSYLMSLPLKDASEYLRLAYCTTVHKMQGQETEVIILPLVNGFSHQLQRNLLYTAVTRAKKKVLLIGHRDALVRAVQNSKQDARNTLFLDRLRA